MPFLSQQMGRAARKRPGTGAACRTVLLALAALVCGLAQGSDLRGQQTPPAARTTASSREVTATRLNGARIELDGQLDEPIWQQASYTNAFIQKDPNEGTPATTDTEVGFVFDDNALYIGARMHSLGRDDIRAVMSRRDNAGNSERLLVSIDSYYDHRTAYTLGITATGVRIDYYHGTDSEHNRDYNWNPVWQAHTQVSDSGWTAEMRIPFSQLRFTDRERQVWGLNMNRYIPSRNEDVYWVQIPKNETGWSSRFGRLTGIDGVQPSRRLELMPYVASDARLTGQGGGDNPFDDGFNFTTRVGGDVRMGLGPNLTLEATINPDFGQVEADPAEVNLSAVETFFSERRPFFTEGSQLLDGDGADFFYSRRIGAAPRGRASGDFVDRPPAATILSAAKITGRLASGLSIATLAALTGNEFADTYDETANTFGRTRIAPLSGYGALRAQQEFGPSASTVGVSLTAVSRDINDESPLADLMTRQAVAGGVDWNLRWDGGAYVLGGSLGFSHVAGNSEAIRRIQRNGVHFFQRPDQDHVTVDPTRTSLTGFVASLEFDKNSGEHWLYGVEASAESPDFEINDAGRLGTTDDIDAFGFLRYRETAPGRLFREYNVSLYNFAGWNFGGIRQYTGIDLESNLTFHNFWQTHLSVELQTSALSDRLTRGGPLMKRTTDVGINGGLFSSFSSNTQWRTFVNFLWDDIGGWFYALSGQVLFRPSSRWQFSVEPEYFRLHDTRQYVSQQAGGSAATYGTRYIFGTIDQSTISAQFRLNYTVTPDLTIELYAEPFASSGQYSDIGELARARTNDLRLYGTDGSTITELEDSEGNPYFQVTDGADTFALAPNFNVLSFRSNLVVRWEWRPGSTVFLVWQQNRSDAGDPRRRAGLGSFFDSFGAEGENFLALKISYWLPVR